MNTLRYLESAAILSRAKDDKRTYFIGAVGIRADGRVVAAYNGNPRFPEPKHHAEFRLSRKLTKGSIVFVARTLWDGSWALAKPCPDCHQRLYNIGVTRVYYTMGLTTSFEGETHLAGLKEYGVIYL